LTSGSHATAGGAVACVAVTAEVLASGAGVSGFEEAFCSCAACWTDLSFDPLGRSGEFSAGALASALVSNHVLAGAETIGGAAPLTGTGGNSLGACGPVGSPLRAGTGAASPAGSAREGDGVECEGGAGRLLASPAVCCTDRPGPVLAGGERVSGTDGAAMLTGAAASPEGDSLGAVGEVASPRLAGIGAASPARFGREGVCIECEDGAGRFFACPAASCAN
jgi:hypothetical protein